MRVALTSWGAAVPAILISIALVFAPTRHFEFVNYDDLEFVVENPHVATGLTTANVRWAFREPYRATGGPVTWISHMLDVQLFGLNAGAHHVVNVAFHAAASIALFAVLSSSTGATLPAAMVACLFAVHPLHVESVAWVSERKDVLSALFWFLTLGAYLAYVRRPSLVRYALVAVTFTLGLLSKPMIATLPLALVLFDYWPLRRWSLDDLSQLRKLLLEKLPLLALSLGAIVATLEAQRAIGAVADFEQVPWPSRIANASVSYLSYVHKMIWPTDLAVFYPYRDSIPLAVSLGCAVVLLVMTIAALRFARPAPYVAVGWLWFVITLAPVAGFIQVGGHSMADRFTYVPLVGLFVATIWGADALRARIAVGRPLSVAAAIAIMGLCVAGARAQTMHWANSVTLWEQAVRATDASGRAHANLGVAFARRGDVNGAIAEYRTALAIEPADPRTHNNLALAMAQQGQAADAVPHYREAIRLDSRYANAYNNLANALAEAGGYQEALTHHREAIRLDPDNGLAHANLAITLGQMDKIDDAIAAMREALRLDPRQSEWHYIMAMLLVQRHDSREAIEHLGTTLAIDPQHRKARAALDDLRRRQ